MTLEFLIPVIIALIVFLIFHYFENKQPIIPVLILTGIMIITNLVMVGIDYTMQTTDTEIWSGTVESCYHKDAWDEWHPPKTYTEEEEYTDSNGKKQTRTVTKTKPGYWEHHPAINQVTTTDGGTTSVRQTPDGKAINDNWPRSVEELYKYWPIGMPSASVHTYKNYIQSSNSLYKHDGINWKDYELPDYPFNVTNYVTINRMIGSFPNINELNSTLNTWNSYLNHTIIKDNGKKGSYKEVNVIFVNLGEDTALEWGFALEEKWKGGNKNDFIVAFGTHNGEINWCYPFTFSDVELLKLQTKNYLLEESDLNNFEDTINTVCTLIEQQFVRTEMATFSYIQIEPSTWVHVTSLILNLIFGIAAIFIIRENY